ncbi:MAG: helix-turn-helix domain-containing protein [Bacilli bacterium]|nr:helix-turn-helix domain-containing protein [Bacilli bacterium]
MSKIKENLANNILELRKINNLTQSELAEKLNYTDKTISKWERGESTPDIESLSALASLFNLTVDDLLHESFDKEKSVQEEKKKLGKSIAKDCLGVITIWLIGTVIFVYNVINRSSLDGFWISFIWPIPLSGLYLFAVSFFKKRKKLVPIYGSITLWTLLAAVYLQMLVVGQNAWIIFIVGIPVQLIIIITYWINN